jgi:hypothetical protein
VKRVLRMSGKLSVLLLLPTCGVLEQSPAGREAGRHRFESQVNIRPGKSEKLIGRSAAPPAQVVNVSKSNKQSRDQFAESLSIRRIEYADGTAWQAPTNK